jgi:hypothetical protein
MSRRDNTLGSGLGLRTIVIVLLFSFFKIHLFIHAYIVWAIFPPCLLPLTLHHLVF